MSAANLRAREAQIVVDGGVEFADFYWDEFGKRTTGGSDRWAATWFAYTSRGVFGHTWHQMSCPFTQFVTRIDGTYLLGVLGRRDEAAKAFAAELWPKFVEAIRAAEVK